MANLSNLSYRFLRPLLFALSPETAHAVALRALQSLHRLHLLRGPARRSSSIENFVDSMGLRFPNRVGLAAGFDKNGRYVDALGALGFGFIEIGTVTPRPQSGQPSPRLFRLPQAHALLNRMGFPNDGAHVVAQRLARRRFRGVLGVNIGKNAITPIEVAVDDYVTCFRLLAAYADYVAINVSSPNTPGLRRLQSRESLEPILTALLGERSALQKTSSRRVPLLVKVSPDMMAAELIDLANLVRKLHIDGVIATNSTVSRDGIDGFAISREAGGLSGLPLRARSCRTVRDLREAFGPDVTIIGVGGIESGSDALDTLSAGANLVQIYTGLVYRGPSLIREAIAATESRAGRS